MKKSSQRTLSRLMAGVMMVSTMFNSTFVNGADGSLTAMADEATSGSAADAATSGSSLVAKAGQTYSEDFADGTKYVAGTALTEGMSILDGTGTITNVGSGNVNGSHGLALKDGTTINVEVAGNATLTFVICAYGGGTYDVTDAAGNAVGSIAASTGDKTVDAKTVTLEYKGPATTLTITHNGGADSYLHSLSVANEAAATGVAQNFKLWLDDLATEEIQNADGSTTKGFSQQTITGGDYGDSVITFISQDEIKWTALANASNITRDGKTVNGYKAGNRNKDSNNMSVFPAFGDGTAIEFTPAEKGMLNTYFWSTSFLRVWDFDADTHKNNGYVDSDTAAESFAVKVYPGHTYVLSTTGKTNNMAYAGLEYIKDIPTTVQVTSQNSNAKITDAVEVSFVDTALGTVDYKFKASASIAGEAIAAELAKGHTYEIKTNDGGVAALIGAEEDNVNTFVAGDEPINITYYDIPDQKLEGPITGTPANTVTEVKFTNKINKAEFVATLNADATAYSIDTIKPGDYTTSVVTTNGGVTYDNVKVERIDQTANPVNKNEVYVEVPDTTVEEGYYNLADEFGKEGSPIIFNSTAGKINNSTSVALKGGDSIVIPVEGVKTVTVSGWYAGTWNINGQNEVSTNKNVGAGNPTITSYTTDGSETSVTVNITDATQTNYLYWVRVQDPKDFKAEYNVPGDYDTIAETMAAIKKQVGIRPEGEAGRITINLTADLQEQAVFDVPYITLNGNGHEINWYYGVGTFYYSNGSDGLYSERLFRDKYAYNEANGNLWGGTVIVRGDHFIGENATFRNTYNFEVTDKEREDYAGRTNNTFPDRSTCTDSDVTAYAAKERSNAFYVEADDIELYKCQVLASQDSFGRNGSQNYGYHVYVKDSVIEGNVDYICGEFTAVFDNCELRWKTYSDGANNDKIGYITAAKTSPYIFRNCYVTKDNEKIPTVLGKFGRTWGANSNATFFQTETNGMIDTDSWGEMTAGDGATSTFYEYNNTVNGEDFVSTSQFAKELTQAQIDLYSDVDADDLIEQVLADWTPVHYAYQLNFTGDLWGDVDQSGILTANDAAIVLAYTLDNSVGNNEEYDMLAADVNADNVITAADAAMILQKVLDGDFHMPAEPITEATTVDNITDFGATWDPEPIVGEDGAEVKNFDAFSTLFNSADAKIEAMQKMTIKKNDNAETLAEDIDDYITSNSVNTPSTVDGVTSTGNRVALAITAKTAVTADIYARIGSTKAIYVISSEEPIKADGVYTSKFSYTNEDTANDENKHCLVDLEAGETVYVVGKGTNIPIYSVTFTGETVYDPEEDADAYTVVFDTSDATIETAQKMSIKPNTDAETKDDYPNYAASNSVNTACTIDGVTSAGNRVAYAITAKRDTKVNVFARIGGGKGIYFVVSDTPLAANGEYTSRYAYENSTNADENKTFTVELSAGETVYVVGHGTNVPFYEISFGDKEEPLPEAVNVFVVGDSTGCHYAEGDDPNYFYKRVGFGDKVADYFNANVTNLALSGRSSKSFATGITTGGAEDAKAAEYYAQLKNELKAGDILIVAFGHNDEKNDDPYRYTAPSGVYDAATDTYTEGSFKASLYDNYVKVAKAAGATVVLCSPIVRRTTTDGSWSANSIHQANGGDYAADVKALAEEQGLEFIDLTNLTKAKYDELTTANTVNLHAWTNSKATSVDNTHLNNYGAKEVAYLMAQNATESLVPYVLADAKEPTVKDLVQNPNYQESSADDLTGDELNSKLWTTSAPWYGTVFGDIGGQGKLNAVDADGISIPDQLADTDADGVTNFIIAENADGSVRIKAGDASAADNTVTAGYGKIAGTTDGLAMYYQPVDAKMNFSISAKAHVNAVGANHAQVSFGAIVADRVLIDENNKITIPYVAAAPLKMGTTVGTVDATTGATVEAWAGYARIDDALKQGGSISTADGLPKAGDVIDVKITKLGDKYTVEYNGVTSEFTAPMEGTVYVGFFAARAADITYSDINFNNEVSE